MSARLIYLITLLIVSLMAYGASRADEVTELTNADVVAQSQPCYHHETTSKYMYGDEPTWCDVTPTSIVCVGGTEPTWCDDK